MKDVKITSLHTGQCYKYLYVLVDKLIIRRQHIITLKTTIWYIFKNLNILDFELVRKYKYGF